METVTAMQSSGMFQQARTVIQLRNTPTGANRSYLRSSAIPPRFSRLLEPECRL